MNVQALLTPKQKQAFDLLSMKTTYTALYGGSRSGKSMGLMIFVLLLCLLKPSRHLIVRKFMSDLIKSIWYETLPRALDLMEIPARAYKTNANMHTIIFKNGSEIWLGGVENQKSMDKILGKEYSTAWVNEASEFDPEIIPNIMSRLAQKSGIYPRLMLDFNPPETSHWTYDLVMNNLLNGAQVNVKTLHMNPVDNVENLNPAYLEVLNSMPERQKKRFLEGMFVTPDEAIFTETMIKFAEKLPVHFHKIIIGVDPAISNKATSDETGIMVLGAYQDIHYKLEDLSHKGSPEAWALRAINAFEKYSKMSANCEIVAEVNQGGDMVGSVLDKIAKQKGIRINYKAVHTSVSKQYRAEDFSIMLSTMQWYFSKQADFTAYIRQMLGYTNLLANNKSPDRIDAAIIAASQLCKAKRTLLYTTV